MEGRILFYNPQTGEGKLILKSGEKHDFTVELWSDFDEMPNVGSVVLCEIQNVTLVSMRSHTLEQRDEKAPISKKREPLAVKDKSLSRQATFSVQDTIHDYFKPIDGLIGPPPEIVNTKEQLDYFLIKRFLLTAYNDLKDLDGSLHNNKNIKKILTQIQQFQKAYITVKERLDVPRLSFEMIFLRSQPEYLQFIRHKEQCLNRISILSLAEESLFPDIQNKELEYKKIPFSDEVKRKSMEEELKRLRTHYVNTIHENAEVFEELSTMQDVKELYTQKYYDAFVQELLKEGGKYQQILVNVLNYRAYEFDRLIWTQAAGSKKITNFFISSDIKGGYSTLTFLHYYLKTLDKTKINEEQKELFTLLDYLEEKNKL